MLDTVIKGGSVVDGTGRTPIHADVGIKDGKIAEVGRISAPAHRVIDAEGLTVTPGWLDIHTHYDSQAIWDSVLEPSFSSGVTTALMGNCGVGMAPANEADRAWLTELMEGVEEVPAEAITAGVDWRWNTFPEFLDALDATPRTFDIGCMVPHGPLRRWTMGERSTDDKNATGDDLARMIAQLDESMKAGAFGLATSRTPVHRTTSGKMTADYRVEEPELVELARIVQRHGGHFQVVPVGVAGEDMAGLSTDMALMEKVVAQSGVNFHLLMFQLAENPRHYLEQFAMIDRMSANVRATAEFSGRCSGAILGFFGANPFFNTPTFQQVIKLPIDNWLAELTKPDVRARILSEENEAGTTGAMFMGAIDRLYDLGDDLDYEPGTDRSLKVLAMKAGKPLKEFAYDFLLANSENPRVYIAFTNYSDGNLDAVFDALNRPNVALSASDAGAHVLTVCDGAMNSFMLTHWARDRKRGPKVPIETVVHWMTQKLARSIDLNDRGVLAPGMKADINIFDIDKLKVHAPRYFNDLPANSRRIMTPVTGYRATMVSGVITRENDVDTGARPGRIVRHGRC